MNNEVKKIPETDPKGYGPKMPVILEMANFSIPAMEILSRILAERVKDSTSRSLAT